MKPATGADLDEQGGSDRAKTVAHHILSDLFKTIEGSDLPPAEIWTGINCLNKLGSDGEAALLAAGLGIDSPSAHPRAGGYPA